MSDFQDSCRKRDRDEIRYFKDSCGDMLKFFRAYDNYLLDYSRINRHAITKKKKKDVAKKWTNLNDKSCMWIRISDFHTFVLSRYNIYISSLRVASIHFREIDVKFLRNYVTTVDSSVLGISWYLENHCSRLLRITSLRSMLFSLIYIRMSVKIYSV